MVSDDSMRPVPLTSDSRKSFWATGNKVPAAIGLAIVLTSTLCIEPTAARVLPQVLQHLIKLVEPQSNDAP